MEEWRARKAEPGRRREQDLQAEQRSQTRSLPVSATRRRGWGGEPRRRWTKYWPEPVEAPETTGEAAVGVEDREAEGVGREGLGGG